MLLGKILRIKGKPLFGARLIEAYEQAGIVYRGATGDPDQHLLPDETRSALTAKAHFWSEEPSALSELKRVLLVGARSPSMNLQPNIERAEADGHPNVALLKALARVINEEAGTEELETDADWRAA